MVPPDEEPPIDVISIVDKVTQQYCRYIQTCCLSNIKLFKTERSLIMYLNLCCQR